MTQEPLSRRAFLKTLCLGAAAAALPLRGAQAAYPTGPIKGTFLLFLKGSYLDVQFGKNPDLHKNPILEKTIQKLPLKSLKPEGFPYSGANSSNWLFAFDLGCNSPAPLTLTLTNKAGVKIEVDVILFEGTRYVGVLRGTASETLMELFGQGSLSEISLSLTDGAGSVLWQSAALKPFRPRSGGNDGGQGNDSSNGGGGGNGGDGPGGDDDHTGTD